MDMGDSDEGLVREIAARHWGACDAVRMLGQGSNNTVFLAEDAGEKHVVKLSKPHREGGALGEYRKEAWCAGQALARGVRTPRVLEFGVFETRAFAVMEFADGCIPSASQELTAWRDLGADARRTHGIAVAGWGGQLHSDGVFLESWPAHVDYNLSSLRPDDPLLEFGVLDAASSRRWRRTLNRLIERQFSFGLCHGDIALRNALVDGGEKAWLLDWGCAVAHVVPHYEINEILRGSAPSPDALATFLDGYGISPSEYDAMTRDLLALSALREVDTLRWAIDKKPDVIEDLSMRAKAAVAKLE